MIALLRHTFLAAEASSSAQSSASRSSTLATIRSLALALVALVTMGAQAFAQVCTTNCGTAPACSGCSQTQTIVQPYTLPAPFLGQNRIASPNQASQTISVPKFNPALGTLQRVEYQFRADFTNVAIHVRNVSTTSPCTIPAVDPSDPNKFIYRVQWFVDTVMPDGTVPPQLTIDTAGAQINAHGVVFPANDLVNEFPFDESLNIGLRGRCSNPANLAQVQCGSGSFLNYGDEICRCTDPAVVSTALFCREVGPAGSACYNAWAGAGNANFTFINTTISGGETPTACGKFDIDFRALAQYEVEVRYIYCPNLPPIANNDSALICTGSTASVDILANDFDQDSCGQPESNGLVCSTVQIVSQPPAGQGTAVVSNCAGNQPCPSCRIVYTPPANFVGTTAFTYRVSDGEGRTSNIATVTVTVCRPTTQNDTVQVCRNSSCSVNVLTNDSAPLGCSPIVPGSVVIVNNPANGTITPPVNGLITYTPNPGYVGPDSFTYRVTDQQGCQSALTTVNVTVCSTPSLIRDNACFCPGTNRLINVLANDTAGSCGPIVASTLAIATPPAPGSGVTAVVEAGQIRVTVADAAPTGQVTFTYTASYTVCGQACSSTGEVCVFVQAAPSALDDSAFIDPTVQPSVLIPVKNNDTASTGCTLGTPTLVAGSITPAGSGTVVWVPAENAFRFTPTPPATMPGQVSFQYDICQTCPAIAGCNVNCTETCCRRARVTINRVCPTFNRLQPASLLLYPKYDARQGRVSLLTITNTNGNKGGDVDVEFRYIDDKMGCHPTGREHRLTPNDTLTMLASTQVPNGSYGYAYAYAKSETDTTANPTGEPIVFNHLIGQVLILDGAAAADWSVSSVNFKGIGAERAPNDDDNDGIRDLNFEFSSDLLPEYEKAPAELRIPRFIGQQQIDETSVILIALSGGQAFTTTVLVDGYNDNEVASSSQYSFDCWDQPRLTTLFPFAQEAAMRGASDDPLEIIGAPHREAGWFRIQGQVAVSDLETIANPAIYAVLVEDIAGFAAADLPYEYCQRNGDLLPKSPLGDGPNPVAGDGQ